MNISTLFAAAALSLGLFSTASAQETSVEEIAAGINLDDAFTSDISYTPGIARYTTLSGTPCRAGYGRSDTDPRFCELGQQTEVRVTTLPAAPPTVIYRDRVIEKEKKVYIKAPVKKQAVKKSRNVRHQAAYQPPKGFKPYRVYKDDPTPCDPCAPKRNTAGWNNNPPRFAR